MAGGLVGLFDDVAALAKLAAGSIDDVGAAASRASVKAAGVVVDDTAVTPAYVQGLAAERELPIIKRIALGSLRNKVLFILPAALLLSEFVPVLVEIILMFGGCFLAYEGAHKLHERFRPHDSTHHSTHDRPADGSADVELADEDRVVSGAIRTDFILSAEIMVIALKEVLDEGFVSRAVILVVVAVAITVIVYGVVALIVKMDDVGLRLAGSDRDGAQWVGRALVTGMPKLLAVLSVVGTAAMLWVGGHIILVGADELGWHGPYDVVHHVEEWFGDVPVVGGVLAWAAATLAAALIGLAIGLVLVAAVAKVSSIRRRGSHDAGVR
jgi:hypothetical protein